VCGLIGFLSASGAAAAVKADIEASLQDMRHRGPDEGGVWADDDVVIGFRRLSIIDIDHSHQPLPYLDGRYWLIFNGEIYNYLELRERLTREFGAQFHTEGDSEAIVAGYHYLGEKVVQHLRGMFAFFIWDTQDKVVFGGYTIYREPISLRAFERLPQPLKNHLARLSTRLPEGLRGKDLLRRGSIPIEERYYGNARIYRNEEMGFYRAFDPSTSHTDVTRAHYLATTHLDDSTRMQYIDLFTWLRGDILVKADKMTMANSLELRVPFLDTEVFAVGSSIPTDQKITKETTKYALRRALADIVPAHVLNRAKLGFPVPIRHWLKDEMYDWARSIITESQADYLIDPAFALQLLAAHRDGPHDYSRKIWTLLVFLVWHGIFVERRIAITPPEPQYPVKL